MLSGDESDYMICRGTDHVKKSGETATHWYGHQYCLSLRAALILILEMKIRAADAKTLKELQASLAEARKELSTAARRIAAQTTKAQPLTR